MSAPRLVLARAELLGVEHCIADLYCPEPEAGWGSWAGPDGVAVLGLLWPEHNSLCVCAACDAVVEAYEVAYLLELDAVCADEDSDDDGDVEEGL